ncbi:hypothetical protein [Burkholderia anthina]|uniref:hypothetical protein n=1 Tax=Burkholderia anthina TaxID=179879 RepID=UPI0012DA8A15|nr:hypothetical protein [Burkholderia anthina]
MAFAEDAAAGFAFRPQRFVHFRRLFPLHHALNACRMVRSASIAARSRASIGNKYQGSINRSTGGDFGAEY